MPAIGYAQSNVVDIVVEADTTKPAGYVARREPSTGSPLVLTALLPSIPLSQQANFEYRWEINGRLVNQTGQSAVLIAPPGRDVAVAVFVQDEAEVIGQAEELIRMSEPQLRLYEENSLRGLSAHPVGSDYILTGRELTLVGVPFFLSDNAITDLAYRWAIDGRQIAPLGNDPTRMTVENTGGSGQSSVSLTIQNRDRLEQVVEATVNIQY